MAKTRTIDVGTTRLLLVRPIGDDGNTLQGGGGVVSGALTDNSVTITTGGTAQQAAAQNLSRNYLFIQNPSGSGGSLWFSTNGTAVQASPSIELVAGASYENPASFCPTGALSVIHLTTGAKITVREG